MSNPTCNWREVGVYNITFQNLEVGEAFMDSDGDIGIKLRHGEDDNCVLLFNQEASGALALPYVYTLPYVYNHAAAEPVRRVRITIDAELERSST